MKTEEILDVLGKPPKTKKETMAQQEFVSTGCDLIDLTVGGGIGMGFPFGYVIGIAGDKSSGKTFLANELLAKAHYTYKDRLKLFADNCEFGDTMDTEKLFGFNTRPKIRKMGGRIVEDSKTVEDMDAKVGLFCKDVGENNVGIYVLDSLDGLSTAEKESSSLKREGQLKTGNNIKDDGTFDTSMSKFLSQQFFKTKVDDIAESNTLLVILSQIRDKIGGPAFGEKSEVNGGRALEFYCHTRLWLSAIRIIMRGGLAVGAVVKAKTKKSKTPRPYRECFYVVYFDFGIDNVGSNICFLYDLIDPKTGLFLPASKMIPWDLRKEKNKANVIEWLERIGRLTQAKKDKKEFDGKAFTNEWLDNWIAEDPECVAGFKEEFGETFTLDEMIVKADTDSALRKEIHRRVIEKWEAREEEARTKRPRKYSEEE